MSPGFLSLISLSETAVLAVLVFEYEKREKKKRKGKKAVLSGVECGSERGLASSALTSGASLRSRGQREEEEEAERGRGRRGV
eukprot:272410-Rhodomonas_salina.1